LSYTRPALSITNLPATPHPRIRKHPTHNTKIQATYNCKKPGGGGRIRTFEG
jgi:hypothetical protein